MSALDGKGTKFPNGVNVDAGELYIADAAVTATAAELNKLASVTAGTVAASKAIVADANKQVTEIGLSTGAVIKGSRFHVTFPNIAAADVAKAFFVAPAACKIISAYETHGTVCDTTDTMTIEKCNTGKDAGAGAVALATAWTLNSTANTPVSVAAVTDGKEILVAGDTLMLKFASGDGTNYTEGCVTVLMQWT